MTLTVLTGLCNSNSSQLLSAELVERVVKVDDKNQRL